MKFKRIKMINFMRYKDENELSFSCDPDKNVTVVLGNNTYGKTTIAQAFRWVLYGKIINTKYVNKNNVNLLNNEILGNMGPNDRSHVMVEIEVEDGKYSYEFIRKAEFVRKFPSYIAEQWNEQLLMRTKVDNVWSDYIRDSDKPIDQVTDKINMMFPQELSNYFFFDGERWSDDKNNKSDIKDSISTIMGISPLVQMKMHLKDGGGNSVIKKVQSKIVGSDTKYDELKIEQNRLYEEIERCKERISKNTVAAEEYRKKVNASLEIIDGNKNTEMLQKRVESLEKDVKNNDRHLENYYTDIVKEFSRSHTYFAAPLLDEVIKLLKNVDLEGKNIPDITRDTLDYLINEGKCLCGHDILKDSLEYKNLQELKRVIPPEAIGGIVGKFQEKLSEWKTHSVELYDEINKKADLFEGELAQKDDYIEEIDKINKKIDRTINFSLERKKMDANKRSELSCNEIVRRSGLNIEEYKHKINKLTEQMEETQANTEENRRYQRIITYAKQLYASASEIHKSKEAPLIQELNEIIKKNFREMFNEKEKYARIDNDYKLHLYYNRVSDSNGYRDLEEHVLSEGELIARNFVFIVSVLELAKIKKIEEMQNGDDSVVLNLPLVLDGPFSKLSDDNIELIAKVLPNAAEQVIIFMLEKDWEASDLEKHTDRVYMYRVNKEADANSSTIVNI